MRYSATRKNSVICLFFYCSGVDLIAQLDGTIIQAVYNGQGFYMDALFAEFVAAFLKGFFNQESHALQGCACLPHQLHNAERGVAVGQEVVDEKHSVLRAEVFAAHAHGVVLAFGEGMDGGAEHVFHGAGFLFLGKYHRELQQVAHHDGGGNAAGLNGDDFVDACRGKAPHELDRHRAHETCVHLVINEAVHLQYTTGETLAIPENSFFERFHCYF